MCFTVLRSARSSVAPLGQRGREGVSIPPPYPLWTPYPPLNDQGGALDPNAEGRSGRLAEKALYCASDVLRIAFSGRHPPCAPIVYARPSGAPAQRSQRNQRFQRFHDTPTKSTKSTISTKSRFHGTPRKARFQRNQRNHDFTAPQRNHENNETHENNEMPLLRAFRFFRCVWRNRDFVATVGPHAKIPVRGRAGMQAHLFLYISS